MKLNNKGYMLIEIIISFGLAFVIIVYLTNLVLKFKDTNMDMYYETKYLRDKNLITRNIMDDLEKGIVTEIIESNDNNLLVEYNETEYRKLNITNKTITYGKTDYNGNYYTDDLSYYTKTIDESLSIGGIDDCSSLSDGYFCAIINIESMYGDIDYNIKLFSFLKQNS